MPPKEKQASSDLFKRAAARLDLLQEPKSGKQIHPDEILEAYPYLEPDDIAACLRYAARRLDHPTLAA